MFLKIIFDGNGKSNQVSFGVGITEGMDDVYEVDPVSPTHEYILENNVVRPIVEADRDYDVRRRKVYHPIGDQLDSLYKTLQGDPAYDGTELAAEIAHWQSVKDLHPKP